jgi:hypothetical protein
LFFPNFETPRQNIKKIETSAGHRAFLFICVLQRAFMALPPWYFTEGCCDREQHREAYRFLCVRNHIAVAAAPAKP